jgi:hypothetical protein
MSGFHLAQDYDQWQAIVDMVMKLRVPWKVGNFLTRRATVSFSRKSLKFVVLRFPFHHRLRIRQFTVVTFVTTYTSSHCPLKLNIPETSPVSQLMYLLSHTTFRIKLLPPPPQTNTTYTERLSYRCQIPPLNSVIPFGSDSVTPFRPYFSQ